MRPRSFTTPAVPVLLLALVACAATSGSSPAPPSGDATPTPPGATHRATTPPPAGAVGALYTGDLIDALPRVIGGAEVTVDAFSAADLEDMNESTLALIDQLGIARSDVEVAMGYSDEASVLIVAVRLPGVDSATIDSTFIGLVQQDTGTHNLRVASLAGRNVHAWDAVYGASYAWVNGDILFSMIAEDDAAAAQAIASMPMPTVALQPGGGERSARAEVAVTLTGGPDAGTYGKAVTEAGGGGCSRNPMGSDTYGFVSYPEDAVDNLSDVNLYIKDGTGAVGGGTDDFVLTAAMVSGSSYSMNPADGDGSGSVVVQDDGNQASFEISGTTADGVAVELMVTCNAVLDLGG